MDIERDYALTTEYHAAVYISRDEPPVFENDPTDRAVLRAAALGRR